MQSGAEYDPAWTESYDDMAACVNLAIKEQDMTQTFEDFINEIELDKKYGNEYGYLCLLLSPLP